MNSKQLFVLALGMTASMNMNASIDREEEVSPSTLQATVETLAAVITVESTLQKEETIDTENLDNLDSIMDTLYLKKNTPISLTNAQAFNIEGLELIEGTTFVLNGINYIVATSLVENNENILEEVSQN